jgi:Chemotaxis response regulator containing a CheY-like receiver domain and a methylesterase domain
LNKIKVLIVDDSALMRKIISDMINEESDMEVINTARNGEDLLTKLQNNLPDIITLDVEMPKMDGITALRQMKKNNINIPVIVLSSISQKGPHLTMECLEAGAFDFLPKPSGSISLDINKVKMGLVQKIRLAYEKSAVQSRTIARPAPIENRTVKRNNMEKIDAVVIGASTGGPKALYAVITAFPEKLGVPVFVVQHMPVGFTKAFAERLNLNSKIKVVEAADGMSIEKDTVYIAPGGFHMEVGSDRKIHLNTEPTLWGVRPAVDKLFISAAKIYGPHIISAVLTGMGKDGAQGTTEIKKSGGITLAEDKSTCTIYGMPKAAFETGMVDIVLPIDNVANEIVKAVYGKGR